LEQCELACRCSISAFEHQLIDGVECRDLRAKSRNAAGCALIVDCLEKANDLITGREDRLHAPLARQAAVFQCLLSVGEVVKTERDRHCVVELGRALVEHCP
jgi:hypothetical protein